MALLDFFKKKKTSVPEKSKARRETHFQKDAVTTEEKEEKKSVFKELNESSNKAFEVISSPHITEKSTAGSASGSYVFKVRTEANKHQIKAAIEELYGVKVNKINVAKVPSKKRYLRGKVGEKSGYKKAHVFLESGNKIELV